MSLTKTNWLVIAIFASLLLATTAVAQEPVEGADDGAADFDGDGSESGVDAAPIPTDGEELGSGDVESDLNLYWGGKREVAVVQKRLFTKAGRAELSLFSGIIPNDPFLTYIPIGGRFNYYFVESISLEIAGSFTGDAVQIDSELTEFLKNTKNIQANVDLLDIQQWRADAAVVWSPFYGKLALLQRKLSHFDINLAAGFGVVQTDSPNEERTATESQFKPEGIVGAGFRAFLTESFTLRLDFRQFIFQKVGGGVATPSEISLGVSFFFLGG
jgi:outer membrane beta-barrel protein